MPEVTGNIRDITGGVMGPKNVELIFTINSPNVVATGGFSGRVIPTDPATVVPQSDGSFSVFLQDTTQLHDLAWYSLTIRWLDSAANCSQMDFPAWKISVPSSGGSLVDLIDTPGGSLLNPRMVYVSLTPPGRPRPFMLWIKQDPINALNPANTGNLYELRNV